MNNFPSDSEGDPQVLTQDEASKLQAHGKSNAYERIKRLLPRHHAILDHILDGWSAQEIADKFSMARASISMLSRMPIFQAELTSRRKQRENVLDAVCRDAKSQAQDHLEESFLKAAEVQTELLDNEDPRVQQKAASELLKHCFGSEGATGGSSKLAEGGTKVVIEGAAVQNLVVAMGEAKAARVEPAPVK